MLLLYPVHFLVLLHQVGGEFSLKATAQKWEVETITSGKVDPPPVFSNWSVVVKAKKKRFFLHAAP